MMKLVNNLLPNKQKTSNNHVLLNNQQRLSQTPDPHAKSTTLYPKKNSQKHLKNDLSTKLESIISEFEFNMKLINPNDYNTPYIHNIFHVQRLLAYQKFQSLFIGHKISSKFRRALMKKFISRIDHKTLLIFSHEMVHPYFLSLIDGTFTFFTDKALNISEAKQLLKDTDFQDLSNAIVYMSIELEKSADLLIRSELYSLIEEPPIDKRKTSKHLRQIWAKEDPKSRLIQAEDLAAEGLFSLAETEVPIIIKEGLGLKDITIMGIASYLYIQSVDWLLPWRFSPAFAIPTLHAIVFGYLASKLRDKFKSLISNRDLGIEIRGLKEKLHENLVVLQELNNRIEGMIAECFENISDEEFNKRKGLLELERNKINNPELIFKELQRYEQINQNEMNLGGCEKSFKEIEEDGYIIIHQKNYSEGNSDDGFCMVNLN